MSRTLERNLLIVLSVGILASLVPVPASAQGVQFVLVPAESRVGFTLGDVLHTVHGFFKVKSGTIALDTATGKASGQIVVDATSGESGSGARDRKMHKEILESAKYPEFIFSPVEVHGYVSGTGESRAELQGVLLIHGARHEMTMVLTVQVAGDRVMASTRFVIPYAAWGMKNPSTFILRVNDKVDIDVRAVGHVTSDAGRP